MESVAFGIKGKLKINNRIRMNGNKTFKPIRNNPQPAVN